MPLRAIASLLAPPVCAGCGGHAGSAEPLCGACRMELRWLAGVAEVAGLRVFAPLAYEGSARALARRTGLEMTACLRRTGAARTQVGRHRDERLAGTRGTVAVRPGAAVPERAILVDDVVTTGATVAACAAALRTAGALAVSAVAYARTPAR